ncbi:hypothetical protein VHEMI09697 [[Torrubiella] hemipterigena]|uniref:Uncharacterized protein n=1 Tax=[Torrubiella] hemipterigena TaxID=1531966 RepID=A0A0A1TS06_9HYPO|nr:hypothetical protein VHEMI09697 [[Torrubiella] hemipterigena]
MTFTPRMQQVHLGLGLSDYLATEHTATTKGTLCKLEHAAYEFILLEQCPASVWPGHSYTHGCPRPMLIDQGHDKQLVEFHEALIIAITDIVRRWLSDKDANFPGRMPLEPDEEQLLQWLDEQVSLGTLAPYSPLQMGSWRPDFLVEDTNGGHENFRLSEINARFCFNGFMHGYYGQTALEKMGMTRAGLIGAADGEQFFEGLLDLFDPNLPLHLLKGDEKGIDITMFIHAVRKRLGFSPRLITPAELRLFSDPQQPGRAKLGCLADPSNATGPTFTTAQGEVVEEIHRVGLELHQRELSALDPAILQQVSLRCFNDMRTILLVHDKRMLGIIKQELALLVSRRVLSPAQAVALDKGIADTYLAGSQDLHHLLQISLLQPSVDLKNDFLLKPVRGGKGAGIVFCEDITRAEWLAAVQQLQNPNLVHGSSMVVQRCVKQNLYSLILRQSDGQERYPIVGTYHTVHGKYLGLGTWRSSSERICAVSSGGAWFCSVMKPTATRDC